jgi:hypothetical protein
LFQEQGQAQPPLSGRGPYALRRPRSAGDPWLAGVGPALQTCLAMPSAATGDAMARPVIMRVTLRMSLNVKLFLQNLLSFPPLAPNRYEHGEDQSDNGEQTAAL